jgi:hypothetical protein
MPDVLTVLKVAAQVLGALAPRRGPAPERAPGGKIEAGPVSTELTLTELERKRLWESWIAAEMRGHYFAELAYLYRRRQQIATWSTLVLSSGASIALLRGMGDDWQWVAPVLTLLTAAVSIYSVTAQNQKQSTDAAELHLGWRGVAADYQRLWESGMYSPDAKERLDAIEARSASLSKAGTSFPANRRRLVKWQKYVEQQLRVAHA